MPEVAEVALTAEYLNKHIKNKKIVKIKFVSGRYNKKYPNGYLDFNKDLPMTINKVESKGKFIWFTLENWYIWNTLGMSGYWSIFETKYVKTIIYFSEGTRIYYSDVRNFGTFKFSKNELELEKKLISLTPDFLKDEVFNVEKILEYDVPIVKILMDQKKIGSGLGNYLVAEILYRAKISPWRLGSQVTKKELKILEYWIKYVVKLAYKYNKIYDIKKKNYHPLIKLKEKNFRYLVYRRKNDPFGNNVIGDKIVKDRTTYWVPKVQK